MATSKRCSMCQKDAGPMHCTGCDKYFCWKDFKTHREGMFTELDKIVEERNHLQDLINNAVQSNDQQSPLIAQIDKWGTTINTEFKSFSQELAHLRESDNYVEHDLTRLNQMISQFKQDLRQSTQPTMMEIHTEQSDRINWDSLIYVEEKQTSTNNQQRQQGVDTKKYAEFSSQEQVLQPQAHAKNLSQSTDEGAKGKKKTAQEEKPAKEATKQKDPFATMRKASFNMDEFKRVYSNEDTAEKAIPYFWKNFDKENCSIWFCEYKFPEDLSQIFMTCNLVSGFFQRLDKLRKHAFASMCVFGENNNNTITGIWVWRGQDLAFQLSSGWEVDYESYTWKKLSPDDEGTKQLVNQYFLWEGEHNGKRFNQGKIFK